MAESKKNKRNDYFESFVWKPRPACCLKADGSRDYEKLMALLRAAQDWDHEAQMRIFEQYSGVWQPRCIQNDEVMYRMAMDYEDFQQEAFECFLKSLKRFGDSNPENFKQFFLTNLKNRITNLLNNIGKQIIGHKIPKTQEELKKSKDKSKKKYPICYSMQETYANGNSKYDFEDTDVENEYFKECYPETSKLLTKQELQVAVYHFIEGFSIKATSKQFGVSSRTIDNIISSIKAKLKKNCR